MELWHVTGNHQTLDKADKLGKLLTADKTETLRQRVVTGTA